MTGIGVTGSIGGPIDSDHVYLTSSVLIMVQHAPSFIISLFDSLGHPVAFLIHSLIGNVCNICLKNNLIT